MTPRRRLAAVPENARRVVCYLRVSAVMGRAGEDFLSPDLQLDAIRRLAARSGLVEVEVVQDIDRTGRDFTREGVQRVMELARARAIDVVAVYDLSRFGRNTGESLRHIAELRELGVSVVSTVEQIDDSPEGQFMLGQFLGMAQLYSDQIGRRWSQVIAANAQRGVLHGRAPIGYERTDRRTVSVHEVLGPVMTEVFRRAAAGASMYELARHLSAAAGRQINPSVVRYCLRNPAYLGLVQHQGETLPGRHPALTDQKTWDRIQRRLDAAADIPPRTKEARYALAGLLKCAHCGKAPWRRLPGSKNSQPYFSCRTRRQDGSCPGFGAPRMAEIEEKVKAELRARYLQNVDTSAAKATRRAVRARVQVDRRQLRRDIARTEKAIGRLAARRALGQESETSYQLGLAELEEALDALQAQEREVTDVLEAPSFTANRRLVEAMDELWPRMTTREQRRFLGELVVRVEVRRAAFVGELVADRTVVELREPGV